MKKTFTFQGNSIEYVTERIGSFQWIYVNGRTICVPIQGTNTKSRKSETSSHRNQIISPMPGKITKIIAQDGQDVSKGDSVIVMEAMKMEYTLKAERPGKLKKILVKLGQQVSLGQVLVEFEEVELEKN
ncbi:MAG: acetyl-CoA carboxylase biotin carboxyl carrier protein subunit [Bdellovibrionales bacterium]